MKWSIERLAVEIWKSDDYISTTKTNPLSPCVSFIILCLSYIFLSCDASPVIEKEM